MGKKVLSEKELEAIIGGKKVKGQIMDIIFDDDVPV